MFIWQLGAWSPDKNKANGAAGCKFISHNFWLSHSLNVDVPTSHVLRPYITPSLLKQADPSQGSRDDLVLIDNDTPTPIVHQIERACAAHKYKAMVVKGIRRSDLPKIYRKAKVVIDWCMRGSERMPIEAALHGVGGR